ncbi:4'-phosphopantetheinyl transferase superfamily protein [Streptomyces sp. NPDC002446]
MPWPHGPAQQFAAGRRAAAAALAGAGSAERIVPREAGGRPRFPRGFAGSISHTDHLAVAVVVPGAEAVGVDIETAVISPRVAAFVLRERERHELLPPAGQYTPRELFAAKEAAFKAMNGNGALGEFLFWWIELSPSEGALIASYRDEPVPVWVHSEADLSFALAIRR